MKKLVSGFKPAIGWLIISFILLIIPGSSLPQDTPFLAIPYFDKLVHIAMFAILVWLFCWGFYQRKKSNQKLRQIFLIILVIAGLYGFAMEVVQREFVANRSYDSFDIMADMIGATLGLIFSCLLYIKK